RWYLCGPVTFSGALAPFGRLLTTMLRVRPFAVFCATLPWATTGGPPNIDAATIAATRLRILIAITPPRVIRQLSHRGVLGTRELIKAKRNDPGISPGPLHVTRWRWDSNPRWSCPHTRFRGVLLWP